MEDLLATIEAQCNAVQRTAAGAERAVDRLRHGLGIVSDRSQRIKRDVDEWEEALKRVEAASEELEEAATAYTMPRFVDSVVRGEAKDVPTMVKALIHLVNAKEYLETKPENTVGERLAKRVDALLQKGLKATESHVTTTVMKSMRSQTLLASSAPLALGSGAGRNRSGAAGRFAAALGQTTGGGGGSGTAGVGSTTRMFRDDWRRVLGSLFMLIEQHAMLFSRIQAARDVVELIGDRILKHLESLVTIDYRRRHEGFDSDNSAAAIHHNSGPTSILSVPKLGHRRGGMLAAVRYLMASSSKRAIMERTDTFELPIARGGATISTYRQGDHPLPGFSKDIRELVREGNEVITLVVLKAFPTSEDDHRYLRQLAVDHGEDIRNDAFLLPSELVLRIVDAVFERAKRAIAHVARAPEIGIHDAIFVSLDIVSDLWQWRRVARASPGDHSVLIEEVDRNVDSVVEAARELLDDLQCAKGMLDRAELLKSTASDEYAQERGMRPSSSYLQLIGVHSKEIGSAISDLIEDEPEDDVDDDEEEGGDTFSDPGGAGRRRGSSTKDVLPRAIRTRWLPSLDGAVHPSTTSLIRFLKHLLGGFEAILCLTMAGSCEEADALMRKQKGPGADKAGSWAEPAEEFVDHCLSGHLVDLEAIADAAGATLNADVDDDDGNTKSRRKRSDAGDDGDAEKTDSPFAPFNRPLFLANNLFFVLRSLREDSPFASTPRNRDACEVAIGLYEERLDTALDDYSALWQSALPNPADDPELEAAEANTSDVLTKEQRAAVKKWYAGASRAIDQLSHTSRGQVVAQAPLRAMLSNAAATVVTDAFRDFENNVVRGRRWSDRPEKYLASTPEEIVGQVRALFGVVASDAGGRSRAASPASAAFRSASAPATVRHEEL